MASVGWWKVRTPLPAVAREALAPGSPRVPCGPGALSSLGQLSRAVPELKGEVVGRGGAQVREGLEETLAEWCQGKCGQGAGGRSAPV